MTLDEGEWSVSCPGYFQLQYSLVTWLGGP